MWVISPGSPWCGPSNREDPVLLQGMSPDRPRTMCRLRCRKHSRSIPDSFQKLGWMVRTRWNPMLSYTYICPYTYAYTGIYMNIHIYIYTHITVFYIYILSYVYCVTAIACLQTATSKTVQLRGNYAEFRGSKVCSTPCHPWTMAACTVDSRMIMIRSNR